MSGDVTVGGDHRCPGMDGGAGGGVAGSPGGICLPAGGGLGCQGKRGTFAPRERKRLLHALKGKNGGNLQVKGMEGVSGKRVGADYS